MKIKDVIKKRGFTLEQVAAQMPNSRTNGTGISKQTMTQVVNGNPQISTLRSIANIIGCSVGEFFVDEIEQHRDGVIVCPNCGKQITLHTSCDEREMD